MWLVGTSGVLDELDPESGAVRHVFTSRPQRVLTAVFESADGKVWVGFGDGLGRYDPATGHWREWTAGAGADAAFPGDLTAITHSLVPELQRRGAFRERYEADTLRGLLRLPRPDNRYAAAT